AALTGAPYRVAWDTSSAPDGTYSLTAVARDAAGNVTTSTAIQVTVDKVAPTVTAYTPANGATAVSTAASLTATFSKTVQPGTISFTVTDPTGHAVVGTVSYDGTTNTATFSHGSIAFDHLTVYTVKLSGARDLAGNLLTPVTWSFTTAQTIANATI